MSIINIVNDLFEVYKIILFIRIGLSWFRINPKSQFVYQVLDFIYSVTDPFLNKIRSVLKLNLGAIDFSPILAFLLLEVTQNIVNKILFKLLV